MTFMSFYVIWEHLHKTLYYPSNSHALIKLETIKETLNSPTANSRALKKLENRIERLISTTVIIISIIRHAKYISIYFIG